jgi:hypothetical protein
MGAPATEDPRACAVADEPASPPPDLHINICRVLLPACRLGTYLPYLVSLCAPSIVRPPPSLYPTRGQIHDGSHGRRCARRWRGVCQGGCHDAAGRRGWRRIAVCLQTGKRRWRVTRAAGARGADDGGLWFCAREACRGVGWIPFKRAVLLASAPPRYIWICMDMDIAFADHHNSALTKK